MTADDDLCTYCLHPHGDHYGGDNGSCMDVGETETPGSEPTDCDCKWFED